MAALCLPPGECVMTDVGQQLPRLRSLLGASTEVWAGAGAVRVEDDRWVALSGAHAVDYNVVLCHGAGDGTVVSRSLAEVTEAGVPSLIMIAGSALGEIQTLVQNAWVCVGSVPFMIRPLDGRPGGTRDAAVRRLGHGELDLARDLIAESFMLAHELAAVALREDVETTPGRSVWGAFDAGGAIASCLITVEEDDAVVIWSMATRPTARRNGFGARLIDAALSAAAERGSRYALLHASAEAEPFYRSLGFHELERWQLWSRPRWVLGRA